MIILIGGEKGGTGKTTLATNLATLHASKGKDVLLVDTDKQGSSSNWAESRDEENHTPRITCIQKFGKNLAKDIKDLESRYEDIFIDAGGRDSVELRSSLIIADCIYIPVQASQFDVWTLENMEELITQSQIINPSIRAYTVLNRASTNPNVKETQEAKEFIQDYEHINFSGVIIRDRISFRKASGEGLAVTELKPKDEKSIDEVEALYNHIFSR